MKPVYFLFILLLLPSCWPCDTITIDLGDIPDNGISFVPYTQGETINLEHSNGLVISYSIVQESQETQTFCEWRCKTVYVYEELTTKLIADYPVSNIEIGMNNSDSTYLPCYIYTGGSSFSIPTNEEMYYNGKKVDSLQVGLQTYYDIYQIGSEAWREYSEGEIYTDSIYYNYEFGILKLIQSNGEYFQIYN